MSGLMEVVDREGMGHSPTTGGGKRRRFVISQQPLGTAFRASEQRNSNNVASLCMEVKQMKSTLDLFSEKLDSMEMKMNLVLEKCSEIVERLGSLDQMTQVMKSPDEPTSKSVLFNSQVVKQTTSPNPRLFNTTMNETSSSVTGGGLTESSQIIRLNTEADYPDGSWLGDPCLVDERVRVKMTRAEMDNLTNHCNTPEKMALTLLEILFSRETLAQSNLTGRGKHKKKQLDPLLIFGIFCHLKYRFNIHDADWARIKNNMDAKCRFFWARKCKGLPLGGSKSVSEPVDARRDEQGGTVVHTQYPSYSMYSVWNQQGQTRLVTVGGDGESVYRLDTEEFVTEVQGHEQFGLTSWG